MPPQKRPPMSFEEKKLLKIQQNKIAARQVRNTLIILAVLAGCWFLYLIYVNRQQPAHSDYQSFESVQQIESDSDQTTESPQTEKTLETNESPKAAESAESAL